MCKGIAAAALLTVAGIWPGASIVRAQTVSSSTPAAPTEIVAPSSGSISEPAELTDANSTFFESQSAGISLRIPAGCQSVASSGAGDDIAQYADPIRKWEIKLQRTTHPAPISLESGVDKDGKAVLGLLDKAAHDIRLNLAGVIVRKDLTNIADPGVNAGRAANNVGMIAVRYTSGGSRYLLQEALIRSTSRVYFSIVLTTPIGEGKLDADQATPLELTAVRTFGRVLDSVRLLDTEALRLEQEQRLLRADVLLTQLHARARLAGAMVPEQWIRVMRDGRDVGYSYITQRNAAGPLRPNRPEDAKGNGLLIGIRSRSIVPAPVDDSNAKARKPARPLQLDVSSWWFLSEDQRQEEWSRVSVSTELGADGKPTVPPVQKSVTEFGSTGLESHIAIDRFAVNAAPAAKGDDQQPPVVKRQQRELDGSIIDATGGRKPFSEPLPTLYYLPQALSIMLPQVMPLRPDVTGAPRSYMFLMYVPETHKVMSRYVEVGNPGEYQLGPEKVQAIPITDRLGWHGSVTTHYVTTAGVYLGSENKDTHTVMRATTADELVRIWKNPDLRQPNAIERPRGAVSGARKSGPALQEAPFPGDSQAALEKMPPSPAH